MTTQTQIYNAKIIAIDIENSLKKVCPVSVHVDDWSDYGSFRAFITLKVSSNMIELPLRKVGNIIRREIEHSRFHAVLERLEMPKRTYTSFNYRKYFNGYNGNVIVLDYMVY